MSIDDLLQLYHQLRITIVLVNAPKYLVAIWERNYNQIVTDWLNDGMAFGL